MDLEKAKSYILNLLQQKLLPTYYYHDYHHTLDVHQATLHLMEKENLDPGERPLLETAALYHDSGMISTYDGHEEAATHITREVLPSLGYSPSQIDRINRLILVTQHPQTSETLSEMILCDADLDYLGREDFLIGSLKLRLEWEVHRHHQVNLREWLLSEIDFLQNHVYLTGSGKRLREPGKQKNLLYLRQLIERTS